MNRTSYMTTWKKPEMPTFKGYYTGQVFVYREGDNRDWWRLVYENGVVGWDWYIYTTGDKHSDTLAKNWTKGDWRLVKPK